MLRADAPDFVQFGECYFSELAAGMVKAWKCHREQTQHLAVPVGRLHLVLFDGRDGSPTQGALQEIMLGRPDSYLRVTIPPRIWYGFAAVGDGPALIANCPDLPHRPGECDQREHDDPFIPFRFAHSTTPA